MTIENAADHSELSPLKPSIKIGWAIGELAIAAFVVLQMAFMLFYCTQALGLEPAIAGVALLIPRILDAFADPMMGAISDRTNHKFGRRRIYLLFGAPLLGLSFASIFFIPHTAPTEVKFILLVGSFFLSNLAVTLYEVPYSAMAAEMTQSYKERTVLAGYKMFAARAAGVAVVFAAPMIFGSQADLQTGFKVLGVAAGLFMAITGLWTFFSSKNAPRIDFSVAKFSIRDEIDAVIHNQSFRRLWSAFFAQNLAIGVSATAQIYFITIVMSVAPKDIGHFLVAGSLAALVATPLWVLVGRKIGKQKGYLFGILAAAILTVPAFFLSPAQLAWLVPILILAGIIDAANQLFPNAMIPDTVEMDELRSGQRREGAIFGAWGFARKLGMTGGAFLVSIMLSVIGFIPGAATELQSADALNGIRYIYAGVPLLLWLLTMLLFSRYDLNEAKFEQAKRDISERKLHKLNEN